jgi:hypothetical protein
VYNYLQKSNFDKFFKIFQITRVFRPAVEIGTESFLKNLKDARKRIVRITEIWHFQRFFGQEFLDRFLGKTKQEAFCWGRKFRVCVAIDLTCIQMH